MRPLNRRKLLRSAGLTVAASRAHASPAAPFALALDWIRSTRIRTAIATVSLLCPGEALRPATRDGRLDATVPRVWIHEAVRVELA